MSAENNHVEEHHHRNIQGGAARAAVFGVSDGLVSNVSLIVGIAAADSTQGFVRVAGIAGLVAGAVSMAAGEYVSMTAHRELLEHELALERRELHRNPGKEIAELTAIYEARGVDPGIASDMANAVMENPEHALEVHAREEMGIDPNQLGNAVHAAASSFAAFSVGAVVPLLPWFFGGGSTALILSLLLGLVGAIAVGAAVAAATGRPYRRAIVRQVAIAILAASVTYAVGALVGAEVT